MPQRDTDVKLLTLMRNSDEINGLIMMLLSIGQVPDARELKDAQGIYGWYVRITAFNYKNIRPLFGAAAYNRSVRGQDVFNKRDVQVDMTLHQETCGIQLNTNDLSVPELNYLTHTSHIFAPVLYIGYSKNLYDRLNSHVAFISKGVKNEDNIDSDTVHFIDRLNELNENLRSSGVPCLQREDFFVKVSVADSAIPLRKVSDFERVLIDTIGPIGNRKII